MLHLATKFRGGFLHSTSQMIHISTSHLHGSTSDFPLSFLMYPSTCLPFHHEHSARNAFVHHGPVWLNCGMLFRYCLYSCLDTYTFSLCYHNAYCSFRMMNSWFSLILEPETLEDISTFLFMLLPSI